MVGPSKTQKLLCDEGLLELLYDCEPSDTSEGEFSHESDAHVDMLSGSERRENTDDEDNANDKSDMQYDTWTRVGAERPHFPFSGKPGINDDSEDCTNPLEYFGLFITLFISLTTKLTVKLPVVPKDCIN
jgi:hypothetical protein